MLKPCEHSNCAVCKKVEERKIFKSVLKTFFPEVILCEHAMYKITNSNESEFILPTLECICEGKQGYYVIDVYTSRYIYLNKENFEVICTKNGECAVTPYTQEYIPGQKEKAAD